MPGTINSQLSTFWKKIPNDPESSFSIIFDCNQIINQSITIEKTNLENLEIIFWSQQKKIDDNANSG